MNGWTIVLDACEARHESGLIIRFAKSADDPATWDGTAIAGLDKINLADAARLAREAGDAYAEALKKRN